MKYRKFKNLGTLCKFKICPVCGAEFDFQLNWCPACQNFLQMLSDTLRPKEKFVDKFGFEEGAGRLYHAGGEACEYCPHCQGTADWCPFLD